MTKELIFIIISGLVLGSAIGLVVVKVVELQLQRKIDQLQEKQIEIKPVGYFTDYADYENRMLFYYSKDKLVKS